MVYYITSPSNVEIIKNVCDARCLSIEYVTIVKDLQRFVATESKNLKHVKYFVIDVDCLANSEIEIVSAVKSIKYLLTTTRIIVVAMGKDPNDNLIRALLNERIYNIVLSKDRETAQREFALCLSVGGRKAEDIAPEDLSPFAPENPEKPAELITADSSATAKQELPVLAKKMITIGVCGVEPHVGTTHHAIAITSCLCRMKMKACYLEANIHGDISKMLEVYESGEDSICEDGSIDWSIKMFLDFTFLDVVNQGYQFYVYDLGTCREITSKDFLSKDIKILVSGSKGWEFYKYINVMKNLINISDLYTIMNYSVETDRDMLFLDGLQQATFHADYAPCPFESKTNDLLYQKILSNYLDIPNVQTGSSKHRTLKNFFTGR